MGQQPRAASRKLLADGKIGRGYLGVGLHPARLDAALAAAHALPDRRATMVVSVDPDGPAGKAGVLLRDIIVAFDGAPVSGLGSLFAQLSPESIDKSFKLAILRAGQMTSASVTIADLRQRANSRCSAASGGPPQPPQC